MTPVKSFRKMCARLVSGCFGADGADDTGLTPNPATKGAACGGRRLGWWLAAAGSVAWLTGPGGWWRLPD